MNTTRIPFKHFIDTERITISREKLKTVQVNVGKLCNQACLHCHVEAGPKRTEQMQKKVGDRIIELLQCSSGIETVDITGGAPELNDNFKPIALAAKALGLEVIDRCNLTVFFEAGHTDLPRFLSENKIRVIASLPCYSKENVEQQRGTGVFKKSIAALQLLNEFGYGQVGSGLILDLVYNPLGAFLPPEQSKLEQKYKEELQELFQISFNQLFTITNVPISRFLHQLRREQKYDEYMNLLAASFNLQAAEAVMCRSLLSVGWTGELFDCDFNQMLEMPLGGVRKTIWEIDSFNDIPIAAEIAFADHCYACTAGSGSSCSGSLVTASRYGTG